MIVFFTATKIMNLYELSKSFENNLLSVRTVACDHLKVTLGIREIRYIRVRHTKDINKKTTFASDYQHLRKLNEESTINSM